MQRASHIILAASLNLATHFYLFHFYRLPFSTFQVHFTTFQPRSRIWHKNASSQIHQKLNLELELVQASSCVPRLLKLRDGEMDLFRAYSGLTLWTPLSKSYLAYFLGEISKICQLYCLLNSGKMDHLVELSRKDHAKIPYKRGWWLRQKGQFNVLCKVSFEIFQEPWNWRFLAMCSDIHLSFSLLLEQKIQNQQFLANNYCLTTNFLASNLCVWILTGDKNQGHSWTT